MLGRIKAIQDQSIEWLMQAPSSRQGLVEKATHRSARVAYAIARDLASGMIGMHAMSLVFTTILSVVPLLALSFSILRYFNVQNQFLPMIEHFLLPMGEKGAEINQTILSFVDNVKVGVLGALGLVFLLYTVISLVHKIENAFNSIWYVARSRSLARRFSNYLSLIFVGPIIIVAAISIASGVLESQFVTELTLIEPFGMLFFLFASVMPSLVVIVVFAFFYVLIPNTKVHASSAMIGGLVAGIVWQVVGEAFTTFVVSSARYDVIYSGFAVGIVGLLWLYASWLVLLLGSAIAFYVQNDNYITRELNVKGSPKQIEQLALQIMLKIAHHQEVIGKPIKQNELETMRGVPGVLVRDVINTLLKGQLIVDALVDGECFVLARSSDLIYASDILRLVREDDSARSKGQFSKLANEQVALIDDFVEQSLSNKSLRALLQA